MCLGCDWVASVQPSFRQGFKRVASVQPGFRSGFKRFASAQQTGSRAEVMSEWLQRLDQGQPSTSASSQRLGEESAGVWEKNKTSSNTWLGGAVVTRAEKAGARRGSQC